MISVVIPCYNSEDTIKRALTSVYDQTYKNFEIILVDDGSIDRTRLVIEEFFLNKSSINHKYIYQENSGPSKARNTGVEASSGKYIAFLDSDDEWHERKLELQVNIIEEKNLDFIGSTYTYENFSNFEEKYCNILKYDFKKLILSNKFSTPGVIIEKELFKTLNGFDTSMKYAEDYDLWLRASLLKPLYLIAEPKLFRLYKSAYGEGGLSSHMYPMYKGEVKILDKLFKNKNIGLSRYCFLRLYVFMKFVKRILKKK